MPSLGRSFALLQLLRVKCPLSVYHKEDILLKRFSSKRKVLIYVFVNESTKRLKYFLEQLLKQKDVIYVGLL